jgi:hypothetical protein
MLSEEPLLIEGHAFTTGAVPCTSIEHLLPSAWVEIGIEDRLGCDANTCMNHHCTAEEHPANCSPITTIGTSMEPASG